MLAKVLVKAKVLAKAKVLVPSRREAPQLKKTKRIRRRRKRLPTAPLASRLSRGKVVFARDESAQKKC